MATIKEIYNKLGNLMKENPAVGDLNFLMGGTDGELVVFRDKYMGNITEISYEEQAYLNQYKSSVKDILKEMNVKHYTDKQEEYLLQMSIEDFPESEIIVFIAQQIKNHDFTPTPNYNIEIDESMIDVQDFEYDGNAEHTFSSYLGTYFDVDNKFGIDTTSDEIQLNMYGIYNPFKDSISVECTITFDDRESQSFKYIPTDRERNAIYSAMNKFCQEKDCLYMRDYCKKILKEEKFIMPTTLPLLDPILEKAKKLVDDFCLEEYNTPANFENLSQIGIGYTTVTDEEIPIQAYVNLKEFSLERYLEDKLVDERKYNSLEELIEKELECLDFYDLISVSEEELEKYHLNIETHIENNSEVIITEDILMKFIKSEVPFRMNEIYGISVDSDTMDSLINEVYNNSDVMFNYDKLDNFILSKYSELAKDEISSKNEQDYSYEYQLLDRLRQDCEYFLGEGQRNEKHLWAGNIDAQIKKMRDLYDMLPDKPEWLTSEAINSFAERMNPHNNVKPTLSDILKDASYRKTQPIKNHDEKGREK